MEPRAGSRAHPVAGCVAEARVGAGCRYVPPRPAPTGTLPRPIGARGRAPVSVRGKVPSRVDGRDHPNDLSRTRVRRSEGSAKLLRRRIVLRNRGGATIAHRPTVHDDDADGERSCVGGASTRLSRLSFSALGALPAESSARLRAPYRVGILLALVAFVVADLAALGALAWLLGVDLFWIVVGASVASFALLLVVAGATTWLMLRARG